MTYPWPDSASRNSPELLSGPLGRRMFRDVAVQDPPRADLDHHKDVQDLNRRGHRGEEVEGDDVTGMIVKEGRPALTGTVAADARRASSIC
jgi:hypothetical protein